MKSINRITVSVVAILVLGGCVTMQGKLEKTAGPPSPPPPPTITASQIASPSGDTTRVTVFPDAIYDIAVSVAGAGSVEVQNEAFSAANFNGDVTHAPTQDVFYDFWHLIDLDDDGVITDSELSIAGLTLTGANGLALGVAGSVQGTIRWFSNTPGNNYHFDFYGSNFTENFGWRIPTGYPAGANYLLNVDADGTMGYTDPASLGGSTDPDALDGDTVDDNLIDIGIVSGITAFGESFLDDDNSTEARSTLGLGTIATQNVGTLTNGLYCTYVTGTGIVCNSAGGTHDAVTLGDGIGGLTLLTQELGLSARLEAYHDYTDPNADRIWFWDDSAGAFAGLAPGNSVAITTTTIDTIQDIRTTATPQFARIGAGQAADATNPIASSGFSVDPDGDVVGKSFATTKQSGVAGDMGLYEANSTDTHAAGFRGPASITGDGAYRGQLPNARATSPNMVLAWTNAAETGTGTAADPYIQATSFVDLDNYQAADATLTDIADGTIAEDLVNTANPWADNEVADALTISGGTINNSVIGGSTAAAGTFTVLIGNTSVQVPSSTSLPGTCTIGQLYVDTDADTDGTLYICRATNTWKDIDDDGGAGGMATTDIDTSAELVTIVTDETGSATGTPLLVFNQNPSLNSATILDSGTLTFDESAADPNDADIALSATDGVLKIASVNGANNETLTVDLDATANTATVGTDSGVTTVSLGALNMATTGTILGAINIVTTTDGTESPTAAQMYGTMFIADHATATSDTDYTLPGAAAGMSACFYDNGAGTGGIIIDAATGDEILLYGTSVGVADAIDSPGVAGDGANGDFICLVALDATYWVTMGSSGTWVDGGAD